MIILRRRPIILRRRALRLSPSYCQVAPGVLLLRHLQRAGHQVKEGKQVHDDPQVLVRYAELSFTYCLPALVSSLTSEKWRREG